MKPIHYSDGRIQRYTRHSIDNYCGCGVHVNEKETERYSKTMEGVTCKGCIRWYKELKKRLTKE
jgi:hypothetical protein